jgi:hypothetical protein
LRTTKSGKFLSDGIASDLFLLNLEWFNIKKLRLIKVFIKS